MESEKVAQLEKVVKAMCHKVLCLKSKHVSSEVWEPDPSQNIEEKVLFNSNDITDTCPTPKEDKEEELKEQKKVCWVVHYVSIHAKKHISAEEYGNKTWRTSV